MKKLSLALLLLIIPCFAARAQKSCEWSNGLAWQPPFYRGSSGVGWVGKRYFDDRHALDLGLFYYSGRIGSDINAYYEWTLPIPLTEGLSCFGGPGAHIGFVSAGGRYQEAKHITYGATLAAGVEYKIPHIPMMVSLDWRPRLTLRTRYNDCFFQWSCVCLSLKFCID